MKTKFFTFSPGDDITLTIKAKFPKFTMLRIDAIEIEDPSTNQYDIDL